MKRNFSNIIFFIKQFNFFIYEKIGLYNILLSKITIGFLYGSLLGILMAYWGQHIFRIAIYGGGLLVALQWLNIVYFNIEALNNITGIESFSQLLIFLQNIIDFYPIEFITCIFFFLFFFIFIKKYNK